MSTSTLDQIRDQQRESWNAFSPGWEKWDAFHMEFLRPSGEAILTALDLKETDHVLDVATGTGEPGLTIARKVPQGKVVGTDLSEGMLKVAAAHAKFQQLSNYEVCAVDGVSLPFPDHTFDAITCRMGFMYFPDLIDAAKEMYRVLKPGGRISASVWGSPDRNPWITSIISVVTRLTNLPPPPPDVPSMFRCATPGTMQRVLGEASFHSVQERNVTGYVRFVSPDHYWQFMTELSPPVVAALKKAEDSIRGKIKDEVYATLQSKVVNGELPLGYQSIILSAKK